MNLDQVRSTLWVRAVETADRDGALLPAAVRDRCTAEAGPPGAADGGQESSGPEAQAFLSGRAALVEAELARRHPGLHVLAAAPGFDNAPAWIAGVAVFVAGLASALGWKRQPMELLAFPLLWLIAWYLLVYLWLLFVPLLGGGAGDASRPLVQSVMRLLARLRMPRWPGVGRRTPEADVAAWAAAQFLREWMPLQASAIHRCSTPCRWIRLPSSVAGTPVTSKRPVASSEATRFSGQVSAHWIRPGRGQASASTTRAGNATLNRAHPARLQTRPTRPSTSP